jgi:hypothetical protein
MIAIFCFMDVTLCVFLILWCYHISDHAQGDLATFGYRLAIKVEIY